ncbi:MAG TPA: carboxypeptidase-like regulatory domain-containing protein, partial [Candidatus Binatia bacterium]|nr:carboxypeptidase-like regulatory domain-containing protein [Candidatus Binatia bacterium]
MITHFLHVFGSRGTVYSLGTVLLLFVLSLLSPGQQAPDSASLAGRVRDTQGKPVAGAVLQLGANGAASTTTARTGSDGSYKFSAVHAGIYSLRIVIDGSVETEISSLALAPAEAKTFDCIVHGSKPATPADSSSAKFFDEPRFTVSGVTDTTNLGGHGSDVAVRTRESLAKDTASLANVTPSARPAEPASTERSLREHASRQ